MAGPKCEVPFGLRPAHLQTNSGDFPPCHRPPQPTRKPHLPAGAHHAAPPSRWAAPVPGLEYVRLGGAAQPAFRVTGRQADFAGEASGPSGLAVTCPRVAGDVHWPGRRPSNRPVTARAPSGHGPTAPQGSEQKGSSHFGQTVGAMRGGRGAGFWRPWSLQLPENTGRVFGKSAIRAAVRIG